MKVFFDTEFTGLRQDTTLISIGMVDENRETERTFYAEFNDFDKSQVNKWVQSNVIKKLKFYGKTKEFVNDKDENHLEVFADSRTVEMNLRKWLDHYSTVEMISDVAGYDWVLLTELFGYSNDWPYLPLIPKHVHKHPTDLITLFRVRRIDPDINREEFSGMRTDENLKHNSLWDAYVIKKCYRKLW